MAFLNLFRSKSKSRCKLSDIHPCRPLSSNQINYCITLLYTGHVDFLSSDIRRFFSLSESTKGFSIIQISDDRVSQWLTTNEQDIKITKFPAFLIAREGYQTIVVPGEKAKKVLELINRLSTD